MHVVDQSDSKLSRLDQQIADLVEAALDFPKPLTPVQTCVLTRGTQSKEAHHVAIYLLYAMGRLPIAKRIARQNLLRLARRLLDRALIKEAPDAVT